MLRMSNGIQFLSHEFYSADSSNIKNDNSYTLLAAELYSADLSNFNNYNVLVAEFYSADSSNKKPKTIQNRNKAARALGRYARE